MLALWILFLVFMSTLGLVLFASFSNKKAEQYLPPVGQFAQLGSTRLHYLDQGSGPTVVLIHGLAGNLHNFAYGVAKPLSQHFRVLTVDRPGCGYSTREKGADASLEAQADTIVSLLDHLNIESAVLVGHSLGGAISLAAAQRHPNKVKALALIAPLTHAPDEPAPVFKSLDIESALIRQIVAWTIAVPGSLVKISNCESCRYANWPRYFFGSGVYGLRFTFSVLRAARSSRAGNVNLFTRGSRRLIQSNMVSRIPARQNRRRVGYEEHTLCF